ncbi:MAG: TetR/AcrR family transcriptional regulator [Solobacterium sp.]|jgi:AcrR family transcriptional regulator|nr:TetR/AcrR family transcriptional regulator [Solobacterium sp.]MCH4205050.1 TetR/AcrR family transcriptional regulator [Solobacterium sp.]MCH4226559.1 TetR/AcrR family transcriptional regulator [Solobacterium sp.]MCH4281843.1 TetR/AcrR family transcriptional regulator [Solobacterium sp.]
MNPKITSEQKILETCREIVSEEGIQALNMRHIAECQGISLGSLYHYYPSKEAMLSAAVESVWQDIFALQRPMADTDSFISYIRWLYDRVKKSRIEYPNFSMAHSMSFAASSKQDARTAMNRCFEQIKHRMAQALAKDHKVNAGCFTKEFTKKDLIDFVFSSFFASLMEEKENSRILLQVIIKCIYE